VTRAQEAIEELNDAIDSLHAAALHLLASGQLEMSQQVIKAAERAIAARADLWRNL
jgi:hypothetical protein